MSDAGDQMIPSKIYSPSLVYFLFKEKGSILKGPFLLVVMNPKAENSCAVRRAKLSKQTAPSRSEKTILELDKQ